MTYPTLYRPEDATRGYTPRIPEFMEEGMRQGLRNASSDKERGALVLIDFQIDFCRSDGSLYVPGAEDDVRRIVEFIYNHAEDVTAIYATLDTHLPLQIFFSPWWENPKTGKNPAPFTLITASDIRSGAWRARIDPVWSHNYVHELEKQGKKALMIWPFHTMLTTPGHNLMPALAEAIAWHSAARMTQPTFLTKGDVPRTERYGAFAPEIPDPKHPRGGTDTNILDALGKYNRTWWAGEAETHCVLESQVQATSFFAKDRSVLERMFFLMDCTSPIHHPDIDFVGIARSEQTRMAQMGVQLAKSTDQF